MAAWDVDHANLFDRVEEKTGIVPFGRLVDEVMNTEPYKSVRRMFWVVDNGSSHCGRASLQRMADAYPTARLIHLHVHASWLNQIELYFSIVQRKALTPNDFPNLQALTDPLTTFAEHYGRSPARSTGSSPATTSTRSSRRSPTANPTSDSRPNDQNFRTALLVTAGQNIDRLTSEASFAPLCGSSPIPVSTGRTDRHRLNHGGDRNANRALHMIAVCRLRYCPRTRAYAERRTAQGKTKTEIIRASSATSPARPTTRSQTTSRPPQARVDDPNRSPSPAALGRSDGPSGPLDIYRNVPGASTLECLGHTVECLGHTVTLHEAARYTDPEFSSNSWVRSGCPTLERRFPLGSRRMLPRNPPRRVGYLLSRFPVTTQTFILRELNGLVQRGAVEIELFTLFGESEPGVHSSAAPWLHRVVRPRPSRLVADAAYWGLRKPVATVRILCAVIADHVLRPAVLARALVTTVYAWQHARTVERLRLDQLHVHFATYPALAAWVIKELTGTPYSVTAHAHDLYIYQDGLARRLREASAVVSISHYNRGFVHAIAGPGVQTPLVRNGLDLGEYLFRAPADTRAGEINVVMVSRFDPSKGHMVLLEALGDAPAPLSRAKVTFVGDGPLLTEVARRARQLNLDSRLVFMGAQPTEIVRAVLTDSDVLVQPSVIAPNGDTEGLPTTLVEAMASGVPVVGTDVTGVPELVHHGVTGLIAKAGDPQSLQDALLVVANDPVLCRKMAMAARNVIESEYDSDRSLGALTDVLLSIGTSASSVTSPDRA